MYNAELAPKSLRGRLVSLNQLAITAGIMVPHEPLIPFSQTMKMPATFTILYMLSVLFLLQASFIIGLICSYFLAGWRVALGVQCLFGVILIVGMLFLPETPR